MTKEELEQGEEIVAQLEAEERTPLSSKPAWVGILLVIAGFSPFIALLIWAATR